MDKTFLHSKPHISQYTSFLMNHFLQMTVFEGSILNWKRKFFIKKFIFIFTPVISFYVTLHIACAQTSSVFYSYMGSISLLFVLHHVLFSFTYLFCISYAHSAQCNHIATSVLQAKTGNSWSYGKGGICWGLSASLFCFWESLIPTQAIFSF